MHETYFRLFANCVPVRGYQKGLIYDLQYERYFSIPLLLFDILETYKERSMEYINFHTDRRFEKGLKKYFDFFSAEGLGFYSKTKDYFTELEFSFEHPAGISNAMLEVSYGLSKKVLLSRIKACEYLGCEAIQLIVNEPCFDRTQMSAILEKPEYSRIKSIEIVLKNTGELPEQNIRELLASNRRLKSVYIKADHFDYYHVNGVDIIFLDQTKESAAQTRFSFCLNLDFFCESQKHHTFFNRKMTIDLGGNIGNGSNPFQSFGNIDCINTMNDLPLIIRSDKFQGYWYACKDNTEICMQCEYRYMCMDSRTPTETLSGKWFAGTDCLYNPYICLWAGEKGYVPVEECGTYRRETGFVPDEGKIMRLNKELWEE